MAWRRIPQYLPLDKHFVRNDQSIMYVRSQVMLRCRRECIHYLTLMKCVYSENYQLSPSPNMLIAFHSSLPLPTSNTLIKPWFQRKKLQGPQPVSVSKSIRCKVPSVHQVSKDVANLWTPDTWQQFPILQQPVYPNATELQRVEQRLKQNPPLVFPGEIRRLKNQLAEAGKGKSFVLQGGDCAESFDQFSAKTVEATFRVLVAQVVAMSYLSGLPICKIGRIAGQFAKPRSSDMERTEAGDLPVFRGDIINSIEKNVQARTPDPQRLLTAYSQSAASLNMLRALAKSSTSMMDWVTLIDRLVPQKYEGFVEQIEDALQFIAASMHIGNSEEELQTLREPEFYASHEALLLQYEAALVREFVKDESGKKAWYSASGHMLWVGERTRQLDGAHVEFLRGVDNPIGIKIGPTMTCEELIQIVDILNPENEEGKIMLIVRMGSEKIADGLPPLLRGIKRSRKHVVWSIDPMHGNTIKVGNGIKTRPFEKILAEVDAFFAAHMQEGTIPGGIHLEMTGEEDVTECLGGEVNAVTIERLGENYRSTCDPRLNGTQSIEMAFEVGNRLRKITKKRKGLRSRRS